MKLKILGVTNSRLDQPLTITPLTGPGSVFVQSTHTGRFSKAVAAERSAQRVAGGGDMVKAAVVTLGILVLLFAFLDVEV